MRYYIADCHFYHKNLLTEMDNRDFESGLGRFDIQLMPLVSGIPGFIFEFKHTGDDYADLEALADRALQQIDEKKYDTELRDAGIGSIVKIGIAFRGKNAVVKRA